MPQTEESFNFSSAQNMKFFRLYRKERMLWDPAHEFFRVRTQRKKAMERIVEKMGIEGLQLKHIRLKLRSYRDMYTREMKKYTRDSDSDPRMPWWLKELSFLKDAKSKEEAAPKKKNDAGESEQSDSCDGSEMSLEMKMPVDFEFISNDSPPQSPDELPNSLHTNTFEPSTSTDNIASTTAESLKDVLSAMNRTQAEMLSVLNKQKEVINKEDHYDTFAKYIASLLRNLPKAKAFALQPKIVTMITSEHMKVSKDE